MAFLSLQNIKKVYPDGTRAVKGIDLEIEKGEFIVFLGPSGCGKTSTLRLIAGLEELTEGKVILDGKDVTKLKASEMDIGFVFQFYALYPHLTIKENILFPLKAVKTPKDESEKRLNEVVSHLELSALLKYKPGQISDGDKQRVALARAMIRKPSLFLMDEPLGNLDISQRHAMASFIKEQQTKSGITTIYVTHDQEEAMTLADRIVVMKDGLIQQLNKPSELYDHPVNLFVANFVGSPGMNKVFATTKTIGLDTFLIPESGEQKLKVTKDLLDGKAVVLGIRPEYLYESDNGQIEAIVELNEFQGSHRIIHLNSAFGLLMMRTASDKTFHKGQRIKVWFDEKHCHYFEQNTGERIK